VCGGGWLWWQASRPWAGDPIPSLARPGDLADLADLHGAAAARRARWLRPGLADHLPAHVDDRDVGVASATLSPDAAAGGSPLQAKNMPPGVAD
jgi:hypothetical protein